MTVITTWCHFSSPHLFQVDGRRDRNHPVRREEAERRQRAAVAEGGERVGEDLEHAGHGQDDQDEAGDGHVRGLVRRVRAAKCFGNTVCWAIG
jgi:hypothetical protein